MSAFVPADGLLLLLLAPLPWDDRCEVMCDAPDWLPVLLLLLP